MEGEKVTVWLPAATLAAARPLVNAAVTRWQRGCSTPDLADELYEIAWGMFITLATREALELGPDPKVTVVEYNDLPVHLIA